MSTDHASGCLDRILAQLPWLTPDEARDARVRARCHAVLTARRTALARARHRASVWKRVVANALVGGFSIVYLSAVIWTVVG